MNNTEIFNMADREKSNGDTGIERKKHSVVLLFRNIL